jgi:hypothetical protein
MHCIVQKNEKDGIEQLVVSIAKNSFSFLLFAEQQMFPAQ